MRSYLW